MITSILILLLYGIVFVLIAPFRLLPDASLPSAVDNAINQAGSVLSFFNSVIPLDILLAVLSAVLAVDGVIILYKIIMWVVRKIPTIS